MLKFEEIDETDINWIIRETALHLTSGQYIEDLIRKSINEGNYYGVKALNGNEKAGFLTFKHGIEFTYPHPKLESKIARMVPVNKVFSGDGIYVRQSIRRGGIGTEMTRMARDMMKKLGGEYFLGEPWVYPDGRRPSETPTAGYGETVYEEYVPYFYKDNSRYGLACAVCGTECRCGAVVRLVKLS